MKGSCSRSKSTTVMKEITDERATVKRGAEARKLERNRAKRRRAKMRREQRRRANEIRADEIRAEEIRSEQRAEQKRVIRYHLSELVRLYTSLAKSRGGLHQWGYQPGYLQMRIENLEFDVNCTIELLKEELGQIGFDEEIDPGDIPYSQYMGSYLTRRKAYWQRRRYWRGLLVASNRPWNC